MLVCRAHRGGAWFVATQAMGWFLFSISLVCLCWLVVQVVAGVAYCIRCWALITGSVMFCAQLVSTSCSISLIGAPSYTGLVCEVLL